ncbi:MAG TPA: UDP-N-acetylmuramoyl-L-alanyl-D-glutamate--2,6-diaminopimelate ligase, partial [Gammaproteobacteria bacterium]|nr:UDP-N-acetylmuramoyl-L-alanyl-D-glutamate--2,6-diaminopimelate ligase [Gammaproteobacteria bacterium]
MAAAATRGRTLGEILGADAGAYARTAITDLTLDSREVVPGAAFVALQGAREHGLRYAAEALARGAAIVLYEPSAVYADAPMPSLAVPHLRVRCGELARSFFATTTQPTLIGVTGTNGKTTVAYLTSQALGLPQRPCGYIGTLGYGLPPKLTRHALTTPDCFTLHREIAALHAPRVALEVSSHALAQQRIAGLTFDTAVFTNLTRDHLDEHGDFASYGRAKARLFELPRLKHAVVNVDDAFGAGLAANLAVGCDLIRTTVRGARGADLSARLKRADLDGLSLEITGRWGAARLVSKLIGDFNAENLLGALGALLAQGVSLPGGCAALGAAQPAPGRIEVLSRARHLPWVVIDYAHTPDALRRALRTLAALGPRRIVCVFGCGGDRDRGKRPLMGAVAAELADTIVLTDDNPRNEDPVEIVRDIRAALSDHPDVCVIHDRRAAIAAALERAA